MPREAHSLAQLEKEIQALYPGTTTWEVGDEAHKNTYSDHNKNKYGVYCAKDILDNAGLSLPKFVAHIVANPHPNLRYVIYNEIIYKRSENFEPEDYYGIKKHKTHVHVSVGNGPDGRSTGNYDSRASWRLVDMNSAPSQPSKPSTSWTEKLVWNLPEQKRGSEGHYTKLAQACLNLYGANLKEDGIFGPNTGRETRDFQRAKNLTVDELIGPKTWTRLLKG